MDSRADECIDHIYGFICEGVQEKVCILYEVSPCSDCVAWDWLGRIPGWRVDYSVGRPRKQRFTLCAWMTREFGYVRGAPTGKPSAPPWAAPGRTCGSTAAQPCS